TSPSIMDYARYNYVAQPGDSACLMQGIGPYDFFAIDWGYRRIPGAATPDAERPTLDSLARLQDSQPWDRWIGDCEAVDPRIITEALGDDPVRASGYGVRNIKRLVPMLIPATTQDRLDNYDRLDDLYGELIAPGPAAVASRRAGGDSARGNGLYDPRSVRGRAARRLFGAR